MTENDCTPWEAEGKSIEQWVQEQVPVTAPAGLIEAGLASWGLNILLGIAVSIGRKWIDPYRDEIIAAVMSVWDKTIGERLSEPVKTVARSIVLSALAFVLDTVAT